MAKHSKNRTHQRNSVLKHISETLKRSDQVVSSEMPPPESVSSLDDKHAMEREHNRAYIDQALGELKKLPTMSKRITSAKKLPPEQRDELRRHESEFMTPILKGVEKRPAREQKKDRLYYRITKGDMSGRKIDYESLSLSGNLLLYVKDHPETWRTIPEEHEDSLIEATNDLEEVLLQTEKQRRSKQAELVGLTNALVCTHDVVRLFKEAGVTPPKIYTRIQRRLEKRRAYLDPDPPKGHPR